MTTEIPRAHQVTFYGGPLHGVTRTIVAPPPDRWVSSEPTDHGTVTVEYERAAPWWTPEQDEDLAAVYVCRSWVRPDGHMRSRHGHTY